MPLNLYQSIVVVQYKLYRLSLVIHNFKGYSPLIVNIKYWLYSYVAHYILVAYFVPNSLYL